MPFLLSVSRVVKNMPRVQCARREWLAAPCLGSQAFVGHGYRDKKTQTQAVISHTRVRSSLEFLNRTYPALRVHLLYKCRHILSDSCSLTQQCIGAISSMQSYFNRLDRSLALSTARVAARIHRGVTALSRVCWPGSPPRTRASETAHEQFNHVCFYLM
jgi:hypothetical protein